MITTTRINSKYCQVPMQEDGSVQSDDIRQQGGIPANRALIVKRADGSNFLINPGERVPVSCDDDFADVPNARLGAR
jgi:hypothetical protein